MVSKSYLTKQAVWITACFLLGVSAGGLVTALFRVEAHISDREPEITGTSTASKDVKVNKVAPSESLEKLIISAISARDFDTARSLFSDWIKKDPKECLLWARSQNNGALAISAFSAWCDSDFEAAFSWAKANAPGLFANSEVYLSWINPQDYTKAFRAFDTLANSDIKSACLKQYISRVTDPAALLAWIPSRSAEEQSLIRERAVSYMAQKNPEEALTWLSNNLATLPESERATVYRGMVNGWLANDRPGAVEWLQAQAGQPAMDPAFKEAAKVLSTSDPVLAQQMITKIQDEATRYFAAVSAAAATNYKPESSLNYFSSVPQSNPQLEKLRVAAMTRVLTSWALANRDAAEAYVRNNPRIPDDLQNTIFDRTIN